MTNKERIAKALDLLAQGLAPFVEVHMARTAGRDSAAKSVATSRFPGRDDSMPDPSFLLTLLIRNWDETFETQLPGIRRNLLSVLRDRRNEWAHNQDFQAHETQFTICGILILLEAVDAQEVDQVRIILNDLNRSQSEQKQEEAEEGADSEVPSSSKASPNTKKKIVHPHSDVGQSDVSQEDSGEQESNSEDGGSAAQETPRRPKRIVSPPAKRRRPAKRKRKSEIEGQGGLF